MEIRGLYKFSDSERFLKLVEQKDEFEIAQLVTNYLNRFINAF